MLPKLGKMVRIETFPKSKNPMDPEYYPELDETPFLPPEDISKYRSIVGSLNWILTLGRFDIAYALNTLSRYNMAPKQGHMKALQKILGYLRDKAHGKLVIDPGIPPI